MKKNIVFILFIMLVMSANAQLISVDALSKIIKDPNVVVIDARPAADYLKTHIDGAIGLDASALSNNTPVEGTLKSSSEMATILGKNGVSNKNKIVVYCKTGVNAGRMYWILKYLGCDDVSVLDGQMDAWFAARKPITKNPKKLTPTNFSASVNSSMLVDKAYVKSKLSSSSTIIVDSRKKADYDAGHIGNAVNIPSEIMLTGSKLKPVADLTSIYSGVSKDKEIILYCKTGYTASFTYFVLKSLLKYPNVKVYDGAYLDWTQK
ncbi:MAG: sulfurtransferase [Paludibacter sp.]|nr:sulfurtransferase [Paludibacter sp.]